MATITKSYTLNIHAEESGIAVSGVKVVIFDINEIKVLDTLTDVNGDIPTADIIASTFETPGMTEVSKNPHDIRALLYGKELTFIDKNININ